jgi:hypothetical protein
MSRVNEMLSESTFKDSARIIEYRQRARDKKYDYETRMRWDRYCAHTEQSIITRAEMLERWLSRPMFSGDEYKTHDK